MTKNTKLDEKLEGAENFRAWKYRIILILKENDLEGFIKEEVAEPEEAEAKSKCKINMIKDKRIIQVGFWKFHEYEGCLVCPRNK